MAVYSNDLLRGAEGYGKMTDHERYSKQVCEGCAAGQIAFRQENYGESAWIKCHPVGDAKLRDCTAPSIQQFSELQAALIKDLVAALDDLMARYEAAAPGVAKLGLTPADLYKQSAALERAKALGVYLRIG